MINMVKEGYGVGIKLDVPCSPEVQCVPDKNENYQCFIIT